MRRIYPRASYGLGGVKAKEAVFSKNHFAGLATYSPEVQEQITSWGLTRVAGNAFICESSRDFWQVQGNKIIKLVGNEVDNGESIPGAPEDKPERFLANILDDLSF